MARAEITGRKVGVTAGPARPEDREEPPEPVKLLAMTIRQFCDAHNVSVAMYFKLKQSDKGPVEFRIGSKVLISHEAASDWRRAREADVAATEKAKKTWTEAHGVLRGPRKVKPEPIAASLVKPGKRKHRPNPRVRADAEADA